MKIEIGAQRRAELRFVEAQTAAIGIDNILANAPHPARQIVQCGKWKMSQEQQRMVQPRGLKLLRGGMKPIGCIKGRGFIYAGLLQQITPIVLSLGEFR